jgi:hypothetical protein
MKDSRYWLGGLYGLCLLVGLALGLLTPADERYGRREWVTVDNRGGVRHAQTFFPQGAPCFMWHDAVVRTARIADTVVYTVVNNIAEWEHNCPQGTQFHTPERWEGRQRRESHAQESHRYKGKHARKRSAHI